MNRNKLKRIINESVIRGLNEEFGRYNDVREAYEDYKMSEKNLMNTLRKHTLSGDKQASNALYNFVSGHSTYWIEQLIGY